jgi:dipeptide/tripeptide permease
MYSRVLAAALIITFRSFDDFQNVLEGFFVTISATAEALFVQREGERDRERDKNVFHCSGIFSAIYFWLALGNISIKNKQ